MIKSINLFPKERYTIKHDDIEKYDYFPRINLGSCPKEIHDKKVYTHLGIIDESFKDYEILKESKIQIKQLLIETKEFKGFPDKIELSDSILSSIKSIIIYQVGYFWLEAKD